MLFQIHEMYNWLSPWYNSCDVSGNRAWHLTGAVPTQTVLPVSLAKSPVEILKPTGVPVGSAARDPSRFRAAEFFAGIGLVRLGLERQNWQVVFANDLDPQKKVMYAANFGEEHWNPHDVHSLAPSEVPDCELFTASFPCNDLSIAGAWEGLSGKESSAFWGFVEVLRHRRTPLVLLENVVGFLQSHGGKDFEDALLALNVTPDLISHAKGTSRD